MTSEWSAMNEVVEKFKAHWEGLPEAERLLILDGETFPDVAIYCWTLEQIVLRMLGCDYR